ncbi:Crp/Fnr family transcriptional regulator [Tranquillimonas rosea]|uniref:Crp/Fnr family transcriptional regulator n=1 Tax=Tranquillimonas rosea TaxID=641238 RepID=UPI001160D0C8|nr:Crp/Fnr family transcriptional regulator [Tranquillimonas rosea]
MPTSELLPLVLSKRDRLDPEDHAALSALPVRTERYEHGATIIPQGPAPNESCLVVAGMSLRTQQLGQSRTIVSAIHIPGDFVDLHAFLLDELDHSVVAQGRCEVQFIHSDALREVTRTRPHLTRLLWMSTLIDAKIHRAWLAASVGLRATERIGHLLSELFVRYQLIGAVRDGTFRMPLEQKDLESLLGYSKTHVNRSVQELRARGLIDWERNTVTVHQPDTLADLSKFDPKYLELRSAAR